MRLWPGKGNWRGGVAFLSLFVRGNAGIARDHGIDGHRTSILCRLRHRLIAVGDLLLHGLNVNDMGALWSC